jgi:hypothetical protein
MGLTFPVVDTLIRERIYKPLVGRIVLIGRQAVYFTPANILALLRKHDITVQGVADYQIEIDRSTAKQLIGFADAELITDRALLRLLGASHVLALDHSSYEGAEIIHDLNKPIPPELQNIADFIIDGSTLDNVFDPAMVLRNFAAMLRPGGRILTINMFSNHYEPYAIMPPLWYLDYFVVNGFADCKVYILIGTKPYNAFTIDIDALLDPARTVSTFSSPHEMTIIVVAEKGDRSTSHVNPVQQQYRSPEQWVQYRANLQRMKANPRPHLCRSEGDITFIDVKAGHLFMDTSYRAQDPMSEIHRLRASEPN